MANIDKITPFLWFDHQAEEAANFYTSIFKNSKTEHITRNGEAVLVVNFSLNGQKFSAMNGGPMYKFNPSVSFVVNCDNQEEVDFFWEKLSSEGGQESMCGWLTDRFGLSWQIIPEALPRLLSDPDPAVAQRAMAAMMQMRKIEIEKLTQIPDRTQAIHITIEAFVNASIEKVWKLWKDAEHIVHWNNASNDWHTPKAVNHLQPGGKFVFTMAAKDGSASFDFEGIYDDVIENQRIAYTMADGRKAQVLFEAKEGATKITETFDAERMDPPEMQREGWQAILNNFKAYAESHD